MTKSRFIEGGTHKVLLSPRLECKRKWDGRMRRVTKPFPFDEVRAAKRKGYKKAQREACAHIIRNWLNWNQMKGFLNAHQEKESTTSSAETFSFGVEDAAHIGKVITGGKIAEDLTAETLCNREPTVGIDLAKKGTDKTVVVLREESAYPGTANTSSGPVIVDTKEVKRRARKPKYPVADVGPVEGRGDTVVPEHTGDVPGTRKARVPRRVQPKR